MNSTETKIAEYTARLERVAKTSSRGSLRAFIREQAEELRALAIVDGFKFAAIANPQREALEQLAKAHNFKIEFGKLPGDFVVVDLEERTASRAKFLASLRG